MHFIALAKVLRGVEVLEVLQNMKPADIRTPQRDNMIDMVAVWLLFHESKNGGAIRPRRCCLLDPLLAQRLSRSGFLATPLGRLVTPRPGQHTRPIGLKANGISLDPLHLGGLMSPASGPANLGLAAPLLLTPLLFSLAAPAPGLDTPALQVTVLAGLARKIKADAK